MNQSETILITGGAGFIGAHVAKRLILEGKNVILLDNFNAYYDPTLKEARLTHLLQGLHFTLYRVDIKSSEELRPIFEHHHIDHIIHLAAQAGVRYSMEQPLTYADSNLIGSINILELAKKFGVKGITLASSSSVYGNADHYPVREEDNTDHPISLYGATKKSLEVIAYSYHHLYQIPITCLRFFTVYGPWGRPDMALFSFTKATLEGTVIDVFGQGKLARDFTYIDDIVDGVVKALEKNLPWAILNLGKGQVEPLMRMIKLIEQTTSKTIEKRFLDMQPGDVRQTWAEITQAKTLLGWEPQTSLDEGVPRFVHWYQDYLLSNRL